MEPFVVRSAASLFPEGLTALAEEARSQGIGNVSVLISRWMDGTERYDQPGESILAAWSDHKAIGVGGLTQCPHVPGAMRVRRFYVSLAWRRQGVAHALAKQLVNQGFQHSSTLTCNAGASAAALPFWESVGFRPVTHEGITHIRTLDLSK